MNDSERLAVNPEWLETFDSGALRRGMEYAEAGYSRIGEITPEYVTGSCQGSGRNHYEQRISLGKDPQGQPTLKRCYCTCPVSSWCKHCAALVFELMRAQDKPAGKVTAPSSPDTLNADIENWFDTLPDLNTNPDHYPAGQAKRLIYHLQVERGHCVITVNKAKQRVDGGYSEMAPVYSLLQLLSLKPRYLLDIDRRICSLLSGLSNQTNHFMLEGQGGGEILNLTLRSERLFLNLSGAPLQAGPARKAELTWVKKAKGGYLAHWLDADTRLETLPLIEPLHYVDREHGQLGVLIHDLPDRLAGHIGRIPEVPAEQALQFSHRLRTVTPQIPLPQPLSERVITDLPPVAHLTLASHEFSAYVQGNSRMQRHLQHRAALAFSYAGKLISDPRSSEVRRSEGAETQRIQRQPAAEKALRQQLLSIGFKVATRQSKALPDSAGEMLQLPNDSAWLDFVSVQVPALQATGWQIQMQPGFHFDLKAVEDWYAKVDEAPGREWFDLELGIVVNGERHSLLPILLFLLHTRPDLLNAEQLAKRGDDEYLLVDLNGWRNANRASLQVALPYSRVRPLMSTLSELYLNEAGATSLRLNAVDAARLTELDELPMTWQGGDRVRQFAERLRTATQTRIEAPLGLNATLRPYQLDGLNWMQTLRELEAGGILGDDMGLGKTLQALAHLLTEKLAGRLDRPCLAVMPTSLIPNWLDEAARFTPQLRVLALHGPGRQKDFPRIGEYDLVLTTYALLPRDLEVLQRHPLHVLILDEAQNIKNPTAKATLAARQLEARQRLCLSGTPLENHLGELWSLFHFLLPGWLGDAKEFNRNYRAPIEKHGDAQRLLHLTTRIKPFLLRRKKEQVASELPPKTEIIHWVDLSDSQRDLYETVRVAMDKKVREEITRNGVGRSQIVILDALLKLRQVCCDLRLVKSAPAGRLPRNHSAGKLGSLLEMLEELLGEGRRILLFSQFTSMLALIEAELVQREIPYSLLTGETRDRRAPVEAFQAGRTPVFLISLKAGGTGLNLTAADTVIHYDPWWNPAAENQATDRAYRIGQDKPVFVYKMIARGTVEEKIQKLQQEKAALAAGILEGGAAADWALQPGDIEALFEPLPRAGA